MYTRFGILTPICIYTLYPYFFFESVIYFVSHSEDLFLLDSSCHKDLVRVFFFSLNFRSSESQLYTSYSSLSEGNVVPCKSWNLFLFLVSIAVENISLVYTKNSLCHAVCRYD